MLYSNRTDVSEGIDVNKTSAYKVCIICHYWYVLNKKFKFQSIVCNGYHDVLTMSIDFNSISISNIYGDDLLLYYLSN